MGSSLYSNMENSPYYSKWRKQVLEQYVTIPERKGEIRLHIHIGMYLHKQHWACIYETDIGTWNRMVRDARRTETHGLGLTPK